MSSDAMKLELIQWLSQLEDKGSLNSLFQIKKSNGTADWYDELTENQRAAIAEGEAAFASAMASGMDMVGTYMHPK